MERTPEPAPHRASARRSLQRVLRPERATTGRAPVHPNRAMPRFTNNVSSSRGVHAVFRWRHACTPTGVTWYPKGSAMARRASTPARFVRVETPTYNVFPMRNTSPPSIVAGGAIVTRRRCRARTGRSNAGSPCRDGVPIEVTTASSSRIMALSSIKTLSGNASSGGSISTATPSCRRAWQYASCCWKGQMKVDLFARHVPDFTIHKRQRRPAGEGYHLFSPFVVRRGRPSSLYRIDICFIATS